MNIFECKDVSHNEACGYFAVNNPATNEIIAYVKKTNKQELEQIILDSKKAQIEYAKSLVEHRSDLLYRFYELMIENKEFLAELMTKEQGKPLNESLGEVVYAASFVKWFSQQARNIDGDIISQKVKGQNIFVLREPIGVCAAITPWNFPLAMITRKLAPALASGCSMIVKSASQTPLSAYALQMLFVKAGFNDKLFVVVNGDSSEIGEVLCKSDIVRKLSFTGSSEVGIKLYEQCSSSIKKLSLELGGNAPFIVFDDTNLEDAISGILASKFRNSGQTCICANRIYAQSRIYNELCDKLVVEISKMKVGNGLCEGVNFGPLIDTKAIERVKNQIQNALSKGAKILLGGSEHELGGNFFSPTLLSDVTDEMIIAQEETFGPIAPIFKFDTEEEVLNRANDTKYGLASYVFTNDYKRQWRMAEGLEYGMVGINTGLISNEVAPFGGVKHSGFGREGSKYGIDEYMELKYICLNM